MEVDFAQAYEHVWVFDFAHAYERMRKLILLVQLSMC